MHHRLTQFFYSALCATALLTQHSALAGDIVVGQINAQSGGAAGLGLPMSLGAQVYIDSINAKGGINGQKIRLITLDDAFQEKKTFELATQLVSEANIVALINTLGAPNIDNLITNGFLEKHQLPVIGPLTNSTTARQRNSPYVFFLRAGLKQEVDAMVKQVGILGFKKVGVFYQNDTSGLDGLKMIKDALAAKGITPVVAASYERKTFNADAASEVFRTAKPDVILTISIAPATIALIRNLGRSISSGAMVIGNSGNSPDVILKELGTDLARGLAIVQVMPSESNTANAIAKEFQDNFKRYGPAGSKPNAISLEGYISAKILCKALLKIKGEPTRQALLQALESLTRLDLGGYVVSFDKTKRQGSTYAEVAVITGGGKLSR